MIKPKKVHLLNGMRDYLFESQICIRWLPGRNSMLAHLARGPSIISPPHIIKSNLWYVAQEKVGEIYVLNLVCMLSKHLEHEDFPYLR